MYFGKSNRGRGISSRRADRQLERNGAYYTRSAEQIDRLYNAAVTEDFVINKKMEGQSAETILDTAEIPHRKGIKLVVAETDRMHPLLRLSF